MKSELPDYNVGGTRFHVDIADGGLRQVSNPANRIPFDEMTFRNGHYEFLFDKSTKNVFKGNPASKPESVVAVRMPHPYKLDPNIVNRMLERIGSRRQTAKHQIRKQASLKP
ncbi:hypothetical protein GCM10011386_38540 [Parapedobacter defluvii]|uniref:Uncharacterized protein n=1 Tax=Parapedobacter defluvii TaxID=2045106 RepID=A0ABQ1MN11_9SPHI|nr:hypothetical protein [Parapedobacter defluvii]GGC42580.1 hypothetical protein GCM10011386_38540 [Parapedobacter defluvii]